MGGLVHLFSGILWGPLSGVSRGLVTKKEWTEDPGGLAVDDITPALP